MKLFLSSQAISPGQRGAFLNLCGKEASDIRLALIENAADVDSGSKAWLYQNRTVIMSHGFRVDLVDLNEYRQGSGLLQRLEACDVIWLGGGNTFYLRWILRETGADEMIQELVRNGKVYGGGSAGAVVAGPTLKHFGEADSPDEAPRVILQGLALTDIVVVPHWAREDYGPIMERAEQRLQQDGYRTLHLTDNQAVAVDDAVIKIVGQ